jgi:hypothetical protein
MAEFSSRVHSGTVIASVFAFGNAKVESDPFRKKILPSIVEICDKTDLIVTKLPDFCDEKINLLYLSQQNL